MIEIICKICGKTVEAENRNRKYCGNCLKAKAIEYRRKNNKRLSEYKTEYNKNHREEIRGKSKEYYKNHREERAEYQKIYRKTKKGKSVTKKWQTIYMKTEKGKSWKKKYQKLNSELLTDNYIKHNIFKRIDIKAKDIPQVLIELKRIQLKAFRASHPRNQKRKENCYGDNSNSKEISRNSRS